MLSRWKNRVLCRMVGVRMRPAETGASLQVLRTTLERNALDASGHKTL